MKLIAYKVNLPSHPHTSLISYLTHLFNYVIVKSMNQKGFTPIILILAGLLLAVGYTIGNFTATHSIIITKINPNLTPQPTPSSNPTTTKSQQTFFTNLTKPSVAPTSQPKLPNSPKTSTTTSPTTAAVPNSIITASGGYSYAGQNLTYTFAFPRDGGDVTGSVSGVCSGPVSGKYDGGDGGNVSGQIPVTCQMGFIKQSYQLNYNGKVYLKDKRVDINWTGNIPFYSNSGAFSLYF